MSEIEYLREKIAEARHIETIGWITLLIGFILIIPCLYLRSIAEKTIEWRGLIPYEVIYHPYAIPVLITLVVSACIDIIGAVLAIYYSWKRSKYLKRLKKLTQKQS